MNDREGKDDGARTEGDGQGAKHPGGRVESQADGGGGGPIPGLDRLYAERTPPPDLEEQVAEDFRASDVAREGSGRERDGRWSARSVLLRAAAALIVFAAGWGLGASTPWAVAPAAGGPESGADAGEGRAYVILVWDDPRREPVDDPTLDPADDPTLEPAADRVAVAGAYAAWARSVAESGIPISGEELGTERALVGAEERPSSESARIGGFFVLDAETLDEVRALAEGHPHVASGGVLEIAPVVRR